MTFYLTCMYVQIVFSSVYVAEWTPSGKALPARLNLCSLCIMSICNFSYFLFSFECRIRVLIAQVSGHCLLVAFIIRILYIVCRAAVIETSCQFSRSSGFWFCSKFDKTTFEL